MDGKIVAHLPVDDFPNVEILYVFCHFLEPDIALRCRLPLGSESIHLQNKVRTSYSGHALGPALAELSVGRLSIEDNSATFPGHALNLWLFC